MRRSSLPNVLGFLAGSVATGLIIAATIAWLRPELLRATSQPAASSVPTATVIAAETRQASAPSATPIATPISPAPEAPRPPASYAAAVRASAPAVVNIYAQRTVTERVPGIGIEEFFGGVIRPRYRERVQQGLGSGVIADRQGHTIM
jgi:S1-C subfamily serine protease